MTYVEEGLIQWRGAKLAITRAGREWVQRRRTTDPDWPTGLPFKVVVGPMASVTYVVARDEWSKLAEPVRSLIGIEMEGFSVATAARITEVANWVVAKGVMDFATETKSDVYKKFAAKASAEVIWKFLAERRRHDPESFAPGGPLNASMISGNADPLSALSLPEGNLPTPRGELFGRADLLSECSRLLSDGQTRLVSLLGPPGVGKTRLALAVAHTQAETFDGHVYLVDLLSVADPDLVLASIPKALRIEAGDPLIEALKAVFAGHRCLILLDNFEQVSAAAPKVAELLDAVPGITVLATSSVPLDIGRERPVDVPPLRDLEAAIQLFNAASGNRHRTLESRATVARLCGLVDHLPLAIELIAARARDLTPDDLIDVVNAPDGVLSLRNPRSDVQLNHVTLTTAIEWSYRHLNTVEQAVFTRLAIFEGGWTVTTAANVVGDKIGIAALTEIVRALVDKRFIYKIGEQDRHARFGMLRVLKQFALDRAGTDPETLAQLRRAHAQYFVRLVEEGSGDPIDTDAGQVDVLTSEHENLNAALGYLVSEGAVVDALKLARVLGPYWWSRNYSQGYEQLRSVLGLGVQSVATGDQRALRCAVQVMLARLCIRQFKVDEARQLLDEALVIATADDNDAVQSEAYGIRALVHIERAEYPQARDDLERAMLICREMADAVGEADCLDGLGIICVEEGKYSEAGSHFARSIELYGDRNLARGWVHNDIAQLRLVQDDTDAAELFARQALDAGLAESDRGLMAWATNYLGHVQMRRGLFDLARESFMESLTQTIVLGNVRPRLRVLEGLAALAASRGDYYLAQKLNHAILRLRSTYALPRSPAEELMIAPQIKTAGNALSEVDRNRAYLDGSHLTLDQATELGREV